MTVTRQQVAEAMGEPDALATLARLYPEAGVTTGPGWQLWLRLHRGWRKVTLPVRAAFFCDADGECGFVAKIVTGDREFVGHDGKRRPIEGHNFSALSG